MKLSTLTESRWRNELLQQLIPFLKDGTDTKHLGLNIISKYVPGFYPTGIIDKKEGSWIISWPATRFLSPNLWWKERARAIEEIGRDFGKLSSSLNSKSVKEVFEIHHWEVEVPVEGISKHDKSGRWRYDAYKDGIAVEVELSSRSQIFKDALKFLIGQAVGQIDVGVIMIRNRPSKKGQPYFGIAERYSHSIFTTLPMLSLIFHGFPKTRKKIEA